MELDAANEAIRLALYELPEDLDDQLERVDFLAVPNVKALRGRIGLVSPELCGRITDETRGVFVGRPAQAEDDDPHVFEDGDPDVAGLPAEGQVVIVADAHETADDVEQTVFHEVAHVLGLSEIECAELGVDFE